jgi:hypothetical protein
MFCGCTYPPKDSIIQQAVITYNKFLDTDPTLGLNPAPYLNLQLGPNNLKVHPGFRVTAGLQKLLNEITNDFGN